MEIIKSGNNNGVFFLQLMNDLINCSLRKTLLENLEKDLRLRYTTEKEKFQYLRQLKRNLIESIDQETAIEVYQLIEIEKHGNLFNLNRNQFLEFCGHWLDIEQEFEKEVEDLIQRYSGSYSEMSAKLNDYYIKNNAFSPEQITRLSFWMYCINSKLDESEERLGEDLHPETPPYEKKYLNIFIPYGPELFKFLNNGFSGVTAEETRYSILFLFLKENKILVSERVQKKYREMVQKEIDLKIGFKRISTTVAPGTDIYKSSLRELTFMYRDFNKKYRNPFN